MCWRQLTRARAWIVHRQANWGTLLLTEPALPSRDDEAVGRPARRPWAAHGTAIRTQYEAGIPETTPAAHGRHEVTASWRMGAIRTGMRGQATVERATLQHVGIWLFRTRGCVPAACACPPFPPCRPCRAQATFDWAVRCSKGAYAKSVNTTSIICMCCVRWQPLAACLCSRPASLGQQSGDSARCWLPDNGAAARNACCRVCSTACAA